MTAIHTGSTAAGERFGPSTFLATRSAVIAITVAGALALNLLIYVGGRALGGAFTYTQAGKPNRVDVVAVTVMSAIPLTIGLSLMAWLSRRWSALITAAKVVALTLH